MASTHNLILEAKLNWLKAFNSTSKGYGLNTNLLCVAYARDVAGIAGKLNDVH